MSSSNDKLAEIVTNVFCPTGQGGGVKPNCSVKGVTPLNPGGSTASVAAGVADKKSRQADAATKTANKESNKGSASTAGAAHSKAGNLHSVAYTLQLSAGNQENAARHSDKAVEHYNAAAYFSRGQGNPPQGNISPVG